MILILLGCMIGISKWSPNDGQTFQSIAGLLSGFSGAFLGRMVPSKKAGSTSAGGDITNVSVTPQQPKEEKLI
jgi:hypothetical protein